MSASASVEAIDLCDSDDDDENLNPPKRSKPAAASQLSSDEALARQLQSEEHERAARELQGGAGSSTGVPGQVVVGSDGWLHWRGEPLDEWLKDCAPSRISRRVCSWISVSKPRAASKAVQFDAAPFLQILSDVGESIQRTTKLKQVDKDAAVKRILDVARTQQETTGKWMLRLKKEEADEVWARVARAVADGYLGCSTKIGPTKDMVGDVPLCCVYTDNFDDKKEVHRLLVALNRVIEPMDIKVVCGFKPDVFTRLGIESGNEWRLPPTIYSVKEVLSEAWEQSLS